LQGPGEAGQAVKLTGDDEFTVCAAVTDVAVGILGSVDLLEAQEVLGTLPAETDLNKAVIWMNGEVYETDAFTSGNAAGGSLTDTALNEAIALIEDKDMAVRYMVLRGGHRPHSLLHSHHPGVHRFPHRCS